MSRRVIYRDNRLTIASGIDHMLGNFIQVFDNTLIDETPEGEGLVFDWSQALGIERNLTGIPDKDKPPIDVVKEYVIQCALDEEHPFDLNAYNEDINDINKLNPFDLN